MASDTTGNLARTFGVYDEANGLALRGTFIISPDGVLLNAEINTITSEEISKKRSEKYRRTYISPPLPQKHARPSGKRKAIKR